ncbi:MAG: TraB/GumN family protein [Gammaproteobacteria bacterium]
MMKYRHRLTAFIGLFVLLSGNPVAETQPPECRDMRTVEVEYTGPDRFEEGILWRVGAPGDESGYIFGTIHVGDESIVDLPEPVEEALAGSRHFVMEAVPDAEQAMQLSSMMFFSDGRYLKELVSEGMFDRVTTILQSYHLPQQAVLAMKPWAAFVTMSYPADLRKILDLVLMETALDNGARVHGLETLREQGEIFNQMPLDDQLRLLADTVCHYDTVQKDFEIMKSLYLQRDLKGLYIHGQSHAFDDNSAYESLTERILHKRNHTMVERMQEYLEQGAAFIAVGAMHLPGEDGILNLLEKQGYRITKIY